MITFKIEKLANLIIASTKDQVWKAWDERDFTERKLKNWMKRIEKECNEVIFIREF
jgi:ribonuclease PH